MGSEEPSVALRFVVPKGKTEASCSEELALTFETSAENGLEPQWISHTNVLKLSPVKTDVFVMDPFEGEAFEHVSKFKCTVVGPMCLMSCLQKGEPVPQLPYPMFTAAMKDLIVTSTGFSREKKDQIKKEVEFMAGIYSNAFHDGVTHLVAAMVRGKKYDVAVKKDTPVMTDEWVSSVFETSKQRNVHATDPHFAKLKCPPLFGLTISVSQMSKKDRDCLKKSIESHGGNYSGALDLNTTSILILTKPDGDKYKYARKWKIPCVTSNWVFDSIEKGYCLETDPYKIESSGSCSTPTKNAPRMLEEVSMCSTIMMPNDTITQHLNETVNSSNATMLDKSAASSIDKMFEQLQLSRVRKAGPFLEDCKIFLSGFSDTEAEFLDKVISAASGLRMKQATSSVTHLIAKKLEISHHKLFQEIGHSPYKVNLQWLVESMFVGRPIEESDFACNFEENRENEPLNMDDTKQLYQKMNDAKSNKPSLDEEQTQYEDDLLAQYRGPLNNAEDSSKNSITGNKIPQPRQTQETRIADSEAMDSQVPPFLNGKKLALYGFDSEVEDDISDWVVEAGGEIVRLDSSTLVDFCIVTINGSPPATIKSREVVTNLWIEECLDEGRLKPIDYYHKPINVKKISGVGDIVMGITNYVSQERQYIVAYAEALGMCSQDIFAKKDRQGARKSTHLVCKTAEGTKYEAALKWNLPIVTKDWLIACNENRKWVSEKPFLLGDCNVCTPGCEMPKPKDTSVSKSLEEEDEDGEVIIRKKQSITQQPNDSEVVSKPVPAPRTPRGMFPTPETKLVNNVTANYSCKISETSGFKTPTNSRTALTNIGIDTPACDRLDIEKLRPKPLELDISSSTPPQRYYADSQPSPCANPPRKSHNEHLPWYLHNAKTPETPYGAFMGGNPSPTTRKLWKHQCKELGQYEMSAEERKECEKSKERKLQFIEEVEEMTKARQSQRIFQTPTPESRKRMRDEMMDDLQKKGKVVLDRDQRPFDVIMEEQLNKIGKSWKNAGKRIKVVKGSSHVKSKTLFEGVVLFVTKKLGEMQSELHSIVAMYGGEYRLNYCADVTHVVFVGKQNDATKEFRIAKNEKKKVVAPSWVFMSRDEGKLLDEDVFPHTYNPSTNLLGVVLRSERSQKESLDLTYQSEAKKRRKNETHPEPDLSADLLKLDQLVELSKNESTSSNRNSMRIRLTSTNLNPDTHNNGKDEDEKVSDIFHSKTQSGPSESQVQWIDPREEKEREKLEAKLRAETQMLRTSQAGKTFDSMDCLPENLTEAMLESETSQHTRSEENVFAGNVEQPKAIQKAEQSKKIRFMLSGLAEDERKDFFDFLSKHNVDFGDENMCDPKATHVIASKLSRSEKMLGSIASGKWILHPSYITECKKQNKIVDEESFEWGNPENKFVATLLKTPLEIKLAEASFRWRLTIQNDPKRGPFEGFKAIIHTSEARKEAFKRLLELGKGTVLSKATPPYRESYGATHCIAETSKLPNIKIDFERLAAKGVAVIGPFYINEFLISSPVPKVDDHILPEYQPFWAKVKSEACLTLDL